MDRIERLRERKKSYETKLSEIITEVKEELLEMPFVEGLAGYIKFQEYPTKLYNCFGIDSGELDTFGKARLKIVYSYGYTDIVGISKEEFEQLTELLSNED